MQEEYYVKRSLLYFSNTSRFREAMIKLEQYERPQQCPQPVSLVLMFALTLDDVNFMK